MRLPDGYQAGRRYPTVFEMSGYDGGSAEGGTLLNDFGLERGARCCRATTAASSARMFNKQYVTVHASVRGTGCSGGEFDLFSRKSAEDGKYIIDQCIARQPWSNGDVALIGHSYGGITGFHDRGDPAHAPRAATLSGLIDDLYRGITYPGGVSNYGFPLAWTGGIRPAYDLLGGVAPGILRPEEPDDVAHRRLRSARNNTLTKRRTIFDDPLLQGLNDTDSEWFRARSLITYVEQINVPMHITGAYQDEQTGPRGPPTCGSRCAGVPKRLVLIERRPQHARARAPARSGGLRRPQGLGRPLPGVKATPGSAPSPRTRRRSRRCSRPTATPTGTLVANGRIESHDVPARDSRRAPTTTCGPGGGLTTATPGATRGRLGHVRLRPPAARRGRTRPARLRPAVHDRRRSRRAALPHRADDARTPRSSGRSRANLFISAHSPPTPSCSCS